MGKRRLTTGMLQSRHTSSAASVSQHIQIRKSTIALAGGGAFTSADIPCGSTLGWYGGVSPKLYADHYLHTADSADYRYAPDNRDAYDPDGRLQLDTGERINVHGWSGREWAELTESGRYGVSWVAGVAGPHPPNWTRFINHASPPNVSVQGTDRGGRSHGFYARRPIAAGEELFIHYGAKYWADRGLVPQRPPQKHGVATGDAGTGLK